MITRKKVAAAVFVSLAFLLVSFRTDAQEISTILMNNTFEIMGAGSKIGQTISGTGFIMGIPKKENPNIGATILITAAHVLNGMAGDSATILLRRVDDQGNYSRYPYPLPIRKNGENLYVANLDADVAVMYVNLPMDSHIGGLSIQLLANDSRLEQLEVHPGDELLCLGFPLGFDFNGFPILRTGMLASYPITPTKIVKKYLFTFHVFPGNSGGPVYFTFANRFFGGATRIGIQQGVIGLVSEQINSTLPEYKNNGLDVAVVVPSSYILETIAKLPSIP